MEQEKNAEIIGRIKYLMKEMGLKQVQFAERIGVDTSNLSKYLNAHMPLSESFLNRLVVNLGVSKEWLMEGTDLPFGKTVVRVDGDNLVVQFFRTFKQLRVLVGLRRKTECREKQQRRQEFQGSYHCVCYLPHHLSRLARKRISSESARQPSISQRPCPAAKSMGTKVIRRISTGAQGRYASA